MYYKKITLLLILIIYGWHLVAQTKDSANHADSTKIQLPIKNGNDSSIQKSIGELNKDTVKVITNRNNRRDYIITGKVVDVNTAEGIPFATVFFPRSATGTVADIDGNFTLQTNNLPTDTLHIEALGYATHLKVLNHSNHEYTFNVEMERSAAVLDGITIHAKGVDPALLLLKRIIEHKPVNNQDKANSYKYEAYNKLEADLQRMTKEQFEKIPMLKSYSFIFDNLDSESDTKPYLPLYMTETLSDYYFQNNPKKQKEIIKASMIKGVNNESMVKYLGSLYQNVNVYRNFIPVFDKKFVSPISNEGAFYYKYTIIDTQKAYGHNIILVQFKPKRASENCFTGDFWVVDTLYALERISMNVGKEVNINWVDKVSLYQEFAPIDSFWFCTKDKFIANFTFYGADKIPGMIGRKTTTYHHISINDTAIDSVLNDPKLKDEVIKLDSAKQKTDLWWSKNRPDSLSKNEKAIYKMVDTINAMPITTLYKNTITFLAAGVKDIGFMELGPYYYIYSSNPVEGNRFRVSIGSPKKYRDIYLTSYLAYGDKDNRFKYGLDGLWVFNRNPRMYVYGKVIHDLNQSFDNFNHFKTDNLFSSLIRKPGIGWKQAFFDNDRIELFRRNHYGLSNMLILQHVQYTPYAPLPSAGIFYDVNGKPSNSVISSEIGINLRYAYREKYLEGRILQINVGTKYPVVEFEVNAGVKGVLNSAYNYQKARLSVKENINVPPFGHVFYNIYAGKYFNTLPYPLLVIHPGNEYYYYDKYTFEMMNSYEFISDQYAGFNFEHTIGGGIFNYIPLFKKLKFRQFWTAKGIIGSLSNENQQLNLNKNYPFRTLQGNPYLEMGTGVSNIFQVFRIDFVWRITPKLLPSESKSRYFGIFVSAHFEF